MGAIPLRPMRTERVELSASDILTPKELAARLKVKVNWIYESSRARGRFGGKPLPVLRVGKYLRFCWPDVVEWLRAGNGGK